jgi:hypothetical protein
MILSHLVCPACVALQATKSSFSLAISARTGKGDFRRSLGKPILDGAFELNQTR